MPIGQCINDDDYYGTKYTVDVGYTLISELNYSIVTEFVRSAESNLNKNLFQFAFSLVQLHTLRTTIQILMAVLVKA